MIQKIRTALLFLTPALVGVLLFGAVLVHQVAAINPLPTPEPKPGSHGLEATKKQAPPTQGAVITTPGGGASFSASPITVSGICPNGLLVQIYNNGVMVGSVMCSGGSFKLEVSLFAGTNELTATVYDELEQAGPTSASVTVTYTDTQFAEFGSLITLTSTYGRRSAVPEAELNWPLQLSGGTGPYAFSIDWGDGSAAELKSQSLAGLVTIGRAYKKAGIYQVSVKATDVKGASAFLQLIAVSSGKVEATKDAAPKSNSVTKVLWIPAVVALLLLGPAYWLGKRSQTVTLRNKMLKERDSYKS